MKTVQNSVQQPAHDAFVEKKSEFIGDAAHIDSLDEALEFVDMIRERHPKSRHVAFAAMCTDDDGRLCERMSDDGEPSGTAGKPILDVLRANDLTDCVVSVTRYFGGILLGSGGLIRAYSSGASLAIKAATIAQIVPCVRFSVRLAYPQLGSFQQLLAQCKGVEESSQFSDVVNLCVIVPQDESESFVQRVTETFRATVVPQRLHLVHRALGA